MKWYLKVLNNYAVFQGRARRKEYWFFSLFNVVIAFVIGLILGIIGAMIGHHGISGLGQIYTLATLIPSIAVGVRRMHDSDRSGWWLLLPLVNLVFLCMDGTAGQNRFGDDPKTEVV